MADKRLFSELMDDLGLVYEREVSVALKRVYWEDLKHLADEVLLGAVRAHRRDPDRGRFFPKPADILAKADCQRSMHPSADEAWGVALQSFDEAETVVWTDQIERARNAALPVWESGDKVGARMAFKAAYERELAASTGQPPVWKVSGGHDAVRRSQAVDRALAAGLVSPAIAKALSGREAMPHGIVSDAAKLLTGKVVKMPVDDKARARLAILRGVIEESRDAATRRRQEMERRDQKARAAIEQRQREAIEAIERMAKEKPGEHVHDVDETA